MQPRFAIAALREKQLRSGLNSDQEIAFELIMTKCTFCNEHAGKYVTVAADFIECAREKFDIEKLSKIPIDLPSCSECASELEGVHFGSIASAALYLKTVYVERYDHLLASSEWTREELEELGYSLRVTIEQSVKTALEVQDRIIHCEKVGRGAIDLPDELTDDIIYLLEQVLENKTEIQNGLPHNSSSSENTILRTESKRATFQNPETKSGSISSDNYIDVPKSSDTSHSTPQKNVQSFQDQATERSGAPYDSKTSVEFDQEHTNISLEEIIAEKLERVLLSIPEERSDKSSANFESLPPLDDPSSVSIANPTHFEDFSEVSEFSKPQEKNSATGGVSEGLMEWVADTNPGFVPSPLSTPTIENQIQNTGEVACYRSRVSPSPNFESTENHKQQRTIVGDDLLDLSTNFSAEEDPELFFQNNRTESVEGDFVPLPSEKYRSIDSQDGDWDLDLSVAPITGDGIGSNAALEGNRGADDDFLKVRKRGRQSVKKAVFQTSTKLSIDRLIYVSWLEDILTKGWCSYNDIDHLVAHCEGNGDLEELRENLYRNLEAAGLNLSPPNWQNPEIWDAKSDVSRGELAETIEAVLTRATRLPGTHRFLMDKSYELRLLEPMVRAKHEIQLGTLASKEAIETILNAVDRIFEGSRAPSGVSLKSIYSSRTDHPETKEFLAHVDTLRHWQANGRVMEGKSRRKALAALDALDLSMTFYKELAHTLRHVPGCHSQANQLDSQISALEAATEHLILEHLPYVRRFASRNVEEGEEAEDVFQVAFIGLQQATRRFDPNRGYRFVIYAAYRMRQAISRWRADEGSIIRVPVHRSEKVAKFDHALERLDVRISGHVSDEELASELDWPADEVRRFRNIPREAEYPASLEVWDNFLPEEQEANALDRTETERIVEEELRELPERQADVIRMRFGIDRDDDMTLEEIGQIYGVTRERIRQIEAKGLDRLSHPGRKRRLQELLGM